MPARERGLPLSPMMARATLRAKAPKTMTRRIIQPQPTKAYGTNRGVPLPLMPNDWVWQHPKCAGAVTISNRKNGPEGWSKHCPYGVPGDRLWGREAWRTLAQYDGLPPRDVPRSAPIWYEADGKAPPEFGRYRHGRFMMRWMSRILRVVESIGVERLLDISEADAMREGIELERGIIVGAACYGGAHQEITADRFFIPDMEEERQDPDDDTMPGFDSAEDAFFRLFAILHGAEVLDANPWVWVIGYGEVPA